MIKKAILTALLCGLGLSMTKAQLVITKPSPYLNQKVDGKALQQIMNSPDNYIDLNSVTTPPVSETGKNPVSLPASSHKTSALDLVKIGTSSNAYTIIRPQTHQVMTNDKLQTVGWIHRQNTNIFGGSPQTTSNGVLRLDLSLDGGESFPEDNIDIGPFNPLPYGPPHFPTPITARCRYPQGMFFLPKNASTVDDLKLIWMAAITDGGGWGNYSYGIARNLTKFGVQDFDFQSPDKYFNFVSRFQDRGVLIPGGLTSGKEGEFWTIDNSLIAATSTTMDSVLLWKGTADVNKNEIKWNRHQRFTQNWTRKTNNGDYNISVANMEFSPDGKWGWAAVMGSTVEKYNSPENIFEEHPHLWYTDDYGDTWNGPISIELRNYASIKDSLLTRFVSEKGDTLISTGIPVVWNWDITVDSEGNPHIFALMLNSHEATRNPQIPQNRDSLGYAMTGLSKCLFDVTTSDHGKTWCPKFIERVNTVQGQISGTNYTYNNYMQVARNEAGTHIFYSWIDDTASTSPTMMRNPNAYEKALRISDDAMTPLKSVTQESQEWTGRIYAPAVAPTVLTKKDGFFAMPTVFLRILTNEETPCEFYYIKNRGFRDADFIKPVNDLEVSVENQMITLCGASSQDVSCKIKNVGSAAVAPTDTIFVSYSVNGGPAVKEFIVVEGLPPNGEQNYTFQTPADISENGTYVIDIWSSVANDQHCRNSMAQVTVQNFGGANNQIFSDDKASGCGTLTLNTRLNGLPTKWYKDNGTTEITELNGKSMVVLDLGMVNSTDQIKVEVTGPSECGNRVLSDVIDITINVSPPSELEALYQICKENAPLKLTATPNGANMDVIWNWKDGNQNREATTNNLDVTKTGTYNVTITDKTTQCVANKTVEARVWDVTVNLDFPASVCRPISINASNASSPEGSGVTYDWYITGKAKLEGEDKEITYNDSLTQSGLASSHKSLLDMDARPITYKVVVKDPIGCKADGVSDEVTIITFDTVVSKVGVKVFVEGVETDVTEAFILGDPIEADCDQWITITDSSKALSTAINGLQWDITASGGSEEDPANDKGSPTTLGAKQFRIKWPCNRLGPKAISNYVYSGPCIDTSRVVVRIIKPIKGLEDELKMGLNLNVYPNPTHSDFAVTIELIKPEAVKLALYDMNGKLISTQNHESNQVINTTFDLATQPAGLYVLKVETVDGVTSRRILKQ